MGTEVTITEIKKIKNNWEDKKMRKMRKTSWLPKIAVLVAIAFLFATMPTPELTATAGDEKQPQKNEAVKQTETENPVGPPPKADEPKTAKEKKKSETPTAAGQTPANQEEKKTETPAAVSQTPVKQEEEKPETANLAATVDQTKAAKEEKKAETGSSSSAAANQPSVAKEEKKTESKPAGVKSSKAKKVKKSKKRQRKYVKRAAYQFKQTEKKVGLPFAVSQALKSRQWQTLEVEAERYFATPDGVVKRPVKLQVKYDQNTGEILNLNNGTVKQLSAPEFLGYDAGYTVSMAKAYGANLTGVNP